MIKTRRGFTMVELLIAMILLAIVGAAVYSMLVNSQRLARRQALQSDLQDDVRAGALILPAELREVGYDDGGSDLLEIATNHVKFRAMRGVGFTCSVTLGVPGVLLIRTPVLGYSKTPSAGDAVSVFVENTTSIAADDQWIYGNVIAVNAVTCPGGGSAIALTVNGLAGTVVSGGPVRFFDTVQMGLYTSGGKSWLGARSWGAGDLGYQPVLGPLADNDGLELKYYNAAGTEVAATAVNINTVRTIGITFRGRSDEPVWIGKGGPKIDTLNMTTRVALRNALRP